MSQLFKASAEGFIIVLHVIPNAPKSEIVGEYGGALKIKIKAPPVDGKANAEILALFGRILKISKSKIEILRGDKSKIKSLLVRGVSAEELVQVLAPYQAP